MLTIAWWLHRWPGSAEGRRRILHSSRSADPAAEPVGGQTRKLKIQQHMFTSRNTATGQQTQQQNLWGVKQGNERYSNTSLPAIWVSNTFLPTGTQQHMFTKWYTATHVYQQGHSITCLQIGTQLWVSKTCLLIGTQLRFNSTCSPKTVTVTDRVGNTHV